MTHKFHMHSTLYYVYLCFLVKVNAPRLELILYYPHSIPLADFRSLNIIEYDIKSYQVKTTIVQCTKLHIEVLECNLSQKEMLVWPTSM